MAMRVLTDQERQSLLESQEFEKKCKWATRDYAAFWAVNDGSLAATEEERIKWGKDRILGVGILLYDITDQFIAIRFLNASKGKQFDLEAAPQPVEVLIAAWVSSNSFEEFVTQYFDILGENINFSIGN